MKLQEKGTFEYLKRKKNQNLLIMLISFAVVFAVFFAGLAVFKSRNNYCTLIATVLVLPARAALSPPRISKCDRPLHPALPGCIFIPQK